MTNSEIGQGAISNILAVAGFVILIAIIVWGAFRFFDLASSGFSSLFSGNSDMIKVTLSNKTVSSGQPLDVSWEHSPAGAGTYALLYQCRDGFQFRSVNATTGVVNPLPCGSAQPLGNESLKTVRLIPALGGASSVDVALTVVYMQTNGSSTTTAASRPQGSATVTVTPPPNAGSKEAAAPTGTTQPPPGAGAARPPQPASPPPQAGKPDLVVRILSVGVIDPYTGLFANRAPSSQYDVVAVSFDVTNQGSGTSGAWYFSAQLPTSPMTPYASPQQKSLAPGARIENTLRFNNVMQSGGVFSVSVDPMNAVAESNENNNYASQWVSGGYGYSTPTPYPYYPYQY